MDTPKHIAIIMDGNGRWALQRGYPRVKGHQAGVSAVRSVVQSCIEKKIPILSLFAFSSENWARPMTEVSALMKLFAKALKSEVSRLHENQVRLQFIGDRGKLSPEILKLMEYAEILTKDNRQLHLIIAMNYGGQWDILEATKKIAARCVANEMRISEIDSTLFSEYLALKHVTPPDLFIRTGGEQRISNFFLWDLAYTELYFTDIQWPDFNKQALETALTAFKQRERRYGYIGSQVEQHA